MSSFCTACMETFMGCDPRLVEGMLKCDISIDASFIGQIYNVLNKRLACNMEEDVNEMINMFMIKSNIPLSESLGFD